MNVLIKDIDLLNDEQGIRLSKILEAFADHHLDGCAISRVEHVSGWRSAFVFRLLVDEGSEAQVYYLKMASRCSESQIEYIEREYFDTEFLAQNLPSCCPPVVLFSEYAGFIMSEIKGERLDIVLCNLLASPYNAQRVGEAKLLIQQCGNWLRSLQALSHADKLGKPVTKVDLQARAERELNLIAEKNGLNSVKLDLLKTKIRSVLASMSMDHIAATLKHNDFAPWNIMVSPQNEIVVFDFANVVADAPLYDVAYFTHGLKKLRSKFGVSSRAMNHVIYAFENEYGLTSEQEKGLSQYYQILFELIDLNSALNASEHNFKAKLLKQIKLVYFRRKIRVLIN